MNFYCTLNVFQGYVYNVNPFNACRPVEPPPNNSSVWIALIARDNCSFVDKVSDSLCDLVLKITLLSKSWVQKSIVSCIKML